MSDEERFIDGIFNYCDRWCERCPFTSRCRVYAMEEAAERQPGDRDPKNAAFWDGLHNIFQQTLTQLREMAREQGIDLEAPPSEEVKRRLRRRKRRRGHPLVKAGLAYAKRVQKWFALSGKVFRRKGLDLARNYL